MNPSEFASELRKRLGISKAETNRLIDATVALITEQLQKNNTISIQNIGTFEVKKRAERVTVSPNTGKKMLIPPKLVVGYKVSPSLKEKIKESPQS